MKLLSTLLFIGIMFLAAAPLAVSAAEDPEAQIREEIANKLMGIQLAIFLLQGEIQQMLNALAPLHPLALGEYLKNLFEDNQITLNESDFLEVPDDVNLAFAKMLNLIPSSYENNQRITQNQAEEISEQFLLNKDKIRYDGLFGKINMHEHYRLGGDIEEFLEAAGNSGISKTVFTPTGFGPNNKGYKIYQKFLLKYIKTLYPERIVAFCTIDEADPRAAEDFEQCLIDGGEGLKLLGGHPNFYDEPFNSENMYKVYKVALQYDAPILLHGSIISLPKIKQELNQVYSDFPDITFIHAHYCSTIYNGINLDQCAEFLDKYPNVYVDLTMGGGIKRYHRYLREDLNKIKDFVVTYQDRILFGADIILNYVSYKGADWIYDRISCDLNLHQEKEYNCKFGEKDLTHKGFNLSKEILKKLYFENPKKVLKLYPHTN